MNWPEYEGGAPPVRRPDGPAQRGGTRRVAGAAPETTSLGCLQAAPALQQNIEQVPVLINRTPEIVQLAADAGEHLIEVPFVSTEAQASRMLS